MKIGTTVLVVLVCILLGACQKAHMAHIDGLTIRETVLDTTYTLGKASGAPSCHVSIQMQYAEGENAEKINAAILNAAILPPEYLPNGLTDVPKAVNMFADQYIRYYRDANTSLYKYDRTHGNTYGQRFQLTVSTQSHYQDILTYTANIKTQSGEQPETMQTIVRNIDTKSGHILSLDDIYIHGAEEPIKSVIVRKLAKSHRADGIDGLRNRQIFIGTEVYLPDNFIVYRDKVIFIYQQGEIAPYDEGELRITVSRSDIGKLMRPDISDSKTTSNNTLQWKKFSNTFPI